MNPFHYRFVNLPITNILAQPVFSEAVDLKEFPFYTKSRFTRQSWLVSTNYTGRYLKT
jgi:hypothetical protein